MFIKVQDKKSNVYQLFLRDAKEGEGNTVNEIPNQRQNGKEATLMFDNSELYYEYAEVQEALDTENPNQ